MCVRTAARRYLDGDWNKKTVRSFFIANCINNIDCDGHLSISRHWTISSQMKSTSKIKSPPGMLLMIRKSIT